MAAKLCLDAAGQRLNRVLYIDKVTCEVKVIKCRSLVVAASPCESARLLLNSKSKHCPAGMANSSGMVGKRLRDSVSVAGASYFPRLRNLPPHNHDGMGRPHLWVEKGVLPGTQQSNQFHFFFAGGRTLPLSSDFTEVSDRLEGYGFSLKRGCRELYGTTMFFVASGKMFSNDACFCAIDPDKTDKWGIPTLQFSFKWSDSDKHTAKAMQDSFLAVTEAAGGTYLTPAERSTGAFPHGLSPGGQGFHEQGTAVMGNNREHSVVNSFGQTHDIPNLFVLDASMFPSSSHKPPTLTILALSWRGSEYLVTQAVKHLL